MKSFIFLFFIGFTILHSAKSRRTVQPNINDLLDRIESTHKRLNYLQNNRAAAAIQDWGKNDGLDGYTDNDDDGDNEPTTEQNTDLGNEDTRKLKVFLKQVIKEFHRNDKMLAAQRKKLQDAKSFVANSFRNDVLNRVGDTKVVEVSSSEEGKIPAFQDYINTVDRLHVTALLFERKTARLMLKNLDKLNATRIIVAGKYYQFTLAVGKHDTYQHRVTVCDQLDQIGIGTTNFMYNCMISLRNCHKDGIDGIVGIVKDIAKTVEKLSKVTDETFKTVEDCTRGSKCDSKWRQAIEQLEVIETEYKEQDIKKISSDVKELWSKTENCLLQTQGRITSKIGYYTKRIDECITVKPAPPPKRY